MYLSFKFFEDTKSRDIFLELLKKQEYLELVEDKTLLLGCREKEGVEVLQVQDANLLNFFRLVRDDFHCWKELVSIRRSAHKQLLQSFLKNAFYNSLQEKLEKCAKMRSCSPQKIQFGGRTKVHFLKKLTTTFDLFENHPSLLPRTSHSFVFISKGTSDAHFCGCLARPFSNFSAIWSIFFREFL